MSNPVIPVMLAFVAAPANNNPPAQSMNNLIPGESVGLSLASINIYSATPPSASIDSLVPTESVGTS